MAQNGNNILVYLNGTAIAGTRSNKIQTECEMLEVTNPGSAEWKLFHAGRKQWAVNVGFLVLASTDARKSLSIGTTYTLQFRDRQGTVLLSGQAIMKQCDIELVRGNLATGIISFQGSGELHDSNA